MSSSAEAEGLPNDVRKPPVVAGVDGSDSARHAGEWAAELASAWGAALHLVHVTSDGPAAHGADPPWLRELRDAAERTGVVDVATRVVAGAPATQLAECSRAAGMVVVGSYGEGARAGMLAGSVALALVEEATCPVAVVRGSAPLLPPPRRGPVVVGTDAASTTDAALQLGAALADTLGSRLLALRARSEVVEDHEELHRAAESAAELAADAGQRLDRCLAPLEVAHPALPIERVVVDDTGLRALLERATDARMLVVGHRRGQRAGRLDSTSRGLVGFAPCPVVVA